MITFISWVAQNLGHFPQSQIPNPSPLQQEAGAADSHPAAPSDQLLGAPRLTRKAGLLPYTRWLHCLQLLTGVCLRRDLT